MAGIYFAGILLNIIFSISLYSMIIFSIFSFFGNKLLEHIKPFNFLSVIIYSSFPGLIIATIYSGLGLPFLDFQTVCFICFSVYMMFVINRLQNNLLPVKGKEDEDDDYFF